MPTALLLATTVTVHMSKPTMTTTQCNWSTDPLWWSNVIDSTWLQLLAKIIYITTQMYSWLFEWTFCMHCDQLPTTLALAVW